MLRSVLALMSSLRLGVGLKDAVQRRIRSAIIVAVACLFVFIAALWGLLTAQFAMLEAGFSGVVASAIIALGLFLAGMATFALLPLANRRHRSKFRRAVEDEGAAGAVNVVDHQVGRMIQQVGPLGVLATAFAIGLVVSRRR